MKLLKTMLISVGAFAYLSSNAAEDLIIDDFEKKNQPWTFEGSAFTGYGSGNYWHPGRFDRGMLRLRGYRGNSMLKSWGQHGRNVDGETGRALSAPFKLERKFLRFLISGGKYPGRACVNLLVEEKVERSATGENSNQMKSVAFDLSNFLEREARIEVIDRETGPWGHVCLDDLVLSNDPGGAKLVEGEWSNDADSVWVGGEFLTGQLSWEQEALKVNGREVKVESVKTISRNSLKSVKPITTGAVYFHNGEIWRADILSFSKGKLTLQAKGSVSSPPETIDASRIASLAFTYKKDQLKDARPGLLYRENGSPVPGKIEWIKQEDVALNSALGILPIPRKGLLHYVFSKSKTLPNESELDEIGLIDGSVFLGKAGLKDQKVILERTTNDTSIEIAWENLLYLKRSGKAATWISDLKELENKSFGPLGPKSGTTDLDMKGKKKHFLSALRVLPQTTLRYQLPDRQNGNPRILQAVMKPVPGSRGNTKVSFAISGKTFYRREVLPEDASETLALSIPDGKELMVQVDYGDRLAYPCGIDLHDAHLSEAVKP